MSEFGRELAVGTALVVALSGCSATTEGDCREAGPLGALRTQGIEAVDDIAEWPVDDGVLPRVDTVQRRAAEIPDANVSAETATAVSGALARFVLVGAEGLRADVADPGINGQKISALRLVVGRMPNEVSSTVPDAVSPRRLAEQALQVSIAEAAAGEPGVQSNPPVVAGLLAEVQQPDLRTLVLSAGGDEISDASAARSELDARQRQLAGQIMTIADAGRHGLFVGSSAQAAEINQACAEFDQAVETKGR